MRPYRLSLIAAAFAATGCVSVAPPDNTYAFRPGTGTVQSAQEARVAIPGGTAPRTPLQDLAKPRWIDGYQLALRMDDGTTQAITQDSSEFHAGDRVQVTPEGRVLKLPAAQSSAAQSSAPQSSAPQPSAPLAVRAGGGTVQSVAGGSVSAAAGASSSAPQTVTLRMDDGTTQVLSVQGITLQPGDRVSITPDGRLLKT